MGLDVFYALRVFRNLNTIFLLDIERAGRRMRGEFVFFWETRVENKFRENACIVVNGFRIIPCFIQQWNIYNA